jgi:hypothetical protein
MPTRTDVDFSKVARPDNYADLVTAISQVGITDPNGQPVSPEDIETALTNAFFQVDRATEYLLAHTGQFPRKPEFTLTEAQKADVTDLRGRFPALYPATIVQVYSASGNDKEAATAILATWGPED